MKKFAAILLVGSSATIFAADTVEYSVEEYCTLKASEKGSITLKNHVKAYQEKLGFKPTRAECQEVKYLKHVAFNSNKNDWNFFQNKPYRGSAIRLTSNQVKKLRAAKVKQYDLMRAYTKVDQ